MATIGTFEIEGSFKLTGRGLVICGDIGSGTVIKDNFFTFNNGQQNMKLKIKGVDFVDNIKEKIAKIGLTFHYDNDKQKEDLQTLQVTKQTATITEL
jgi:translation elongation factor EF-Tu-like GTPase